MGDAEDFWPPIEDVADANSPVVLLRRQAEALSDKTGHRLRGRVTTKTFRLSQQAFEALQINPYEENTDTFTHVFTIEVPALDDYSYTLFIVSHGVNKAYPVVYQGEAREWIALNNADEFKAWLKQTLSSDKTKKILGTLNEQAGR